MRVLDRIQISTDMRHKIAEKLTPGSSLIIADKSIDSAILPEGDDFLVSAKDTPVVAQKSEAKPKHAQVAQAKTKRRNSSARRTTLVRSDALTRSNPSARANTLARSNISAQRNALARSSDQRNALARNNTSARGSTLARSNTWNPMLYGFNNAPQMDRPRLFFRWRWRQCGGTSC